MTDIDTKMASDESTEQLAIAANMNNLRPVLKARAAEVMEYMQLTQGNNEAIKEILADIKDMGINPSVFKKACTIMFKASQKEEDAKRVQLDALLGALQSE